MTLLNEQQVTSFIPTSQTSNQLHHIDLPIHYLVAEIIIQFVQLEIKLSANTLIKKNENAPGITSEFTAIHSP